VYRGPKVISQRRMLQQDLEMITEIKSTEQHRESEKSSTGIIASFPRILSWRNRSLHRDSILLPNCG
jgi:hypothetical protein